MTKQKLQLCKGNIHTSATSTPHREAVPLNKKLQTGLALKRYPFAQKVETPNMPKK